MDVRDLEALLRTEWAYVLQDSDGMYYMGRTGAWTDNIMQAKVYMKMNHATTARTYQLSSDVRYKKSIEVLALDIEKMRGTVRIISARPTS